MEEDDLIVNPGDSISNKGSGPNENALNEIKEIEREQMKDKEKKPIPQSVIFTIFGLISCFLSYIETSLMSSILHDYKNKNIDKSKIFLEDIKYISLFIISLIIIKFKIKKPFLYQGILSFLFSFISYSSSYLYSRNEQSFIILSRVFCIIIVSIFFGIKSILSIRKSHLYEIPFLVWLGLFLAVLGVLIEFFSSYFITIDNGEDNIRFLYHYDDYPNFFLSLTNGICYAGIIFIFDLYCNHLEIIFDTLFYVGLFSSIICFILSLCYSELKKIKNTFSELGNLQVIYYNLSLGAFLLNIFLQSILIKKCSIYSAGIIISAQISIRIIVDAIKYETNSDSNIIFTVISLILCISGLYIICLYHISNRYNEKNKDLNNTESFESNQKYGLMNPIVQNDD